MKEINMHAMRSYFHQGSETITKLNDFIAQIGNQTQDVSSRFRKSTVSFSREPQDKHEIRKHKGRGMALV
jgi:hypothetical protein